MPTPNDLVSTHVRLDPGPAEALENASRNCGATKAAIIQAMCIHWDDIVNHIPSIPSEARMVDSERRRRR